MRLLSKGFMCRGYITWGKIYHTNERLIGTGYHKVLKKEEEVSAFKREADERGTPFVEVDPAVCDYIRDHGDSCVQKMFSSFIEKDGTVAALFPFKQLQHSFILGGYFGNTFNPEEEHQSNKSMRSMIEMMKERVTALVDWTDERAKSKGEHYIAFLDAQLEVCKETEKMIDMWDSPFPRRKEK